MDVTFHPFSSIAVCLSGGGYRAAAFSLGTLSYLHHIGLLEKVDFISSTSGGTITNVFFTYHKSRNKSFESIYQTLLQKLQGEDLLSKAVTLLDDDEEWKEGKSKTIINAFAKVYDRHLLDEEAFLGTFWNQNGKNLEVCFNCTDFSKGLTFRFQTDGNKQSREMVGNNSIFFRKDKEDVLQRIKLADIVAASSCFPIGFEPILLPQDFAHKKLSQKELQESITIRDYDTKLRSLEDGECIGLMDGGITDNQALRSAILSDDRRRNRKQPFDLFLVTDVTSYFITPYALPEIKENKLLENLSLRKIFSKINSIAKLVPKLSLWFGLPAIILLLPVFLVPFTWLKCVLAFLAGACFVIAGVSIWLNKKFEKEKAIIDRLEDDENKFLDGWLRENIKPLQQFDSITFKTLLHFFTTLSFKDFWYLLKTRIDSVTNMSAEINLKHARRLIFNAFFDDAKWESRRCANFIYELSSFNRDSRNRRIQSYSKWTEEEKQLLTVPKDHELEKIAETARTMGTTLWFSSDDVKEEKLKKIIVTGQFSTCSNLLEYVINLQKDTVLTEEQKAIAMEVRTKLEADWKRFLEKPEFLFDLFNSGN